MSDKQIITQLVLNEDEVLMKKKAPKVKEPNYVKVGNGTMNKYGIQSIDLIVEAMECSKPAQHVIKWIKKGMVWNPYESRIEFIVKINPESSAEKKILAKGFKELFDKDLVRRTTKSHFMLNPNAIITDRDMQLGAWEACKKSKHINKGE